MANTKKRENGLYHKNMVVGKKEDGSYIRKSVYAKTKKELEQKVVELTQQINNGIAVWKNDMTFKELSDIWFEQYNPTATERWHYHNGLTVKNHLLPYIGGMKVRDLRQIHLQSIISSLAKKDYSTHTMRDIKQIAARIMKVAVDSDLIVKNPFSGVSIPSKEPNARQPLSPEQIKLVTENWRGHRMGLPVMIMLYAGLRRGEMLALQWEDVDIDKKLIHVTKSLSLLKNTATIKAPKTKAGCRNVPIPNVLLAPLIEVKKTSGVICPSVDGELMTFTAYKRAWDSYMNYLNVCAGGFISDCKQRPRIQKMEPFTAHMLRHTYATMLFEANVDVKSAQKFLGHSSVEVTLSIYTHLTQFKEDAAIDALNEHLDSIGQ